MIEAAGLPVPANLAAAAKTGASRRLYTNPHGNIGRFFVAG